MRTTLVAVLLVALVAATSGHLYGYGYGIPFRGLLGGYSLTNQIYPLSHGYGYGLHHHHLIRKRSAEPDPKPQQGDTVFGTGLTRDRGAALYGNQGVYTLLGPNGYVNPGGVYNLVGTNGYINPLGNTGLYGVLGGNTGLFGTSTGIYPNTGYDYGSYYPVYTVAGYPSYGNTFYYNPYNYGTGLTG